MQNITGHSKDQIKEAHQMAGTFNYGYNNFTDSRRT